MFTVFETLDVFLESMHLGYPHLVLWGPLDKAPPLGLRVYDPGKKTGEQSQMHWRCNPATRTRDTIVAARQMPRNPRLWPGATSPFLQWQMSTTQLNHGLADLCCCDATTATYSGQKPRATRPFRRMPTTQQSRDMQHKKGSKPQRHTRVKSTQHKTCRRSS